MSKKFDDYSIRMKKYENKDKSYLETKIPVLLRIDGKSFHTLCKGMIRPYDQRLIDCINDTVLELVEKIDSVKIAYMQSDEISLLLSDFDSDSTQAWFKYNKQKLESIAASWMSILFYKNYQKYFGNDIKHKDKVSVFDCRAWNMPFTEVNNYFWWRQKDAIKNATSMVGGFYFSNKQIFKKNTGEIKQMLLEEKNIDMDNINHIPRYFERGRCIYKIQNTKDISSDKVIIKNEWILDNNIPIFKNDKSFIHKYIENYFTEEDSNILNNILDDISNRLQYNLEINVLKQPKISKLDRTQSRKIQKELELLLKILYPEYNTLIDFKNEFIQLMKK